MRLHADPLLKSYETRLVTWVHTIRTWRSSGVRSTFRIRKKGQRECVLGSRETWSKTTPRFGDRKAPWREAWFWKLSQFTRVFQTRKIRSLDASATFKWFLVVTKLRKKLEINYTRRNFFFYSPVVGTWKIHVSQNFVLTVV